MPAWRKHRLDTRPPPPWVVLGYSGLKLEEKYFRAVGSLGPVTALDVPLLFYPEGSREEISSQSWGKILHTVGRGSKGLEKYWGSSPIVN